MDRCGGPFSLVVSSGSLAYHTHPPSKLNVSHKDFQLAGPQEFDNDFSIAKQDEWIVVSW